MTTTHRGSKLFACLFLLAKAVVAQFPGSNGGANFGGSFGGGGDNSGQGSFNPSPGGGSSNFASSGSGGGSRYADQLLGHNHIVAHGVMAALAMVIFFPFGAISIRMIPSRIAGYIHAAFQVLGYLLFIAAFGIGVWMARQINFPGFSMLHQAHPIIGIIVFSFLSLQPILGVLHHFFFKRYTKRTIWSYAHLWIGRVSITLGIINGGLGLKLADNASSGEIIAYSVVAGAVWFVWLGAAIYGEVKRSAQRSPPEYQRYAEASEAVKGPHGGPTYYA